MRSVLTLLVLLATTSLGWAKAYSEGPAGNYKRPAMAARRFFAKGVKVRARTIGLSQDKTKALVVAEAAVPGQRGKVWAIEVDLQTGAVVGKPTPGIEFEATRLARFTEWNRVDDVLPADHVVTTLGDATGRGRSLLSGSHKSLRVGLPTMSADTPTRNVLFSLRSAFKSERDAKRAIKEDPADGVSAAQIPDHSPWYLARYPSRPNARPTTATAPSP